MNKPYILIVIGNLGIGGTESHLLKTLPLLTHEYNFTIYTTSFGGLLAQRFVAKGIKVISPKSILFGNNAFSRYLGLCINGLRLALHLLRHRYDAIHFYLLNAYIVGGTVARLLNKKPLLMSRRCLNDYQQRRRFFAFLEQDFHGSMNCILANSHKVAAQLQQEGVAPEKLKIIYNGVKTELYDQDSQSCRNNLKISPQTLVITIIANLFAYKGHADLLKALALIKDQLPQDWILLCIGRDEGRLDQLELLARELDIQNNIDFIGECLDVRQYITASDMGLLCSHEEGFSNAVLEFMSAAKAMVVTNVGGNPEAIIDGECGYVVPAKDPNALSSAILKLSQDPALRKRFGSRARERVISEFSLERSAQAYSKMYQEIIVNSLHVVKV